MAGGCWNGTITWLFLFFLGWLTAFTSRILECWSELDFTPQIPFMSTSSLRGDPHRTLLNCENLMVPVTIFLTMPAYLVFLQNEAIFNYLSPLQLVGIYFKFKIFYSLALVTLSYKSKLYSRCLLLLCFFLAECL